MLRADQWWQAYRFRVKRRRYLWRAFRARRQLHLVQDHRAAIRRGDIVAVVVLRNESLRLPHFLDYYRRLGVDHFLVVDNASDDASAVALRAPDVTVWRSDASYRASRFGVDWSNWLLTRYGRGHWCLTVDVDELIVFPRHDCDGLRGLIRRLEARNQPAYGALMIDMFPRGAIGQDQYEGGDPLDVIPWFDAGPFRKQRQAGLQNLWVQGGTRDRAFFADDPRRAPTLNKLPLVRWRRGYAYVNSTHSILPRRLNHASDGPGGAQPHGALLHTKFLPDIGRRSAQERARGQHFVHPHEFEAYYSAVIEAPVLWHPGAVLYKDWKQLRDLHLIRD